MSRCRSASHSLTMWCRNFTKVDAYKLMCPWHRYSASKPTSFLQRRASNQFNADNVDGGSLATSCDWFFWHLRFLNFAISNIAKPKMASTTTVHLLFDYTRIDLNLDDYLRFDWGSKEVTAKVSGTTLQGCRESSSHAEPFDDKQLNGSNAKLEDAVSGQICSGVHIPFLFFVH